MSDFRDDPQPEDDPLTYLVHQDTQSDLAMLKVVLVFVAGLVLCLAIIVGVVLLVGV